VVVAAVGMVAAVGTFVLLAHPYLLFQLYMFVLLEAQLLSRMLPELVASLLLAELVVATAAAEAVPAVVEVEVAIAAEVVAAEVAAAAIAAAVAEEYTCNEHLPAQVCKETLFLVPKLPFKHFH
jgi:hypothetical protein